MKRICILLSICVFLSCNMEPEVINYGKDVCHYCQMTIVTKTHAAQLVTDKGKQFKFDAIECMIHFLDDKPQLVNKSKLLIVDYNSPGVMTDAKSAGYLVSAEISSPMGANLTGFSSLDLAKQTINDTAAEYYDWNGIIKKLN